MVSVEHLQDIAEMSQAQALPANPPSATLSTACLPGDGAGSAMAMACELQTTLEHLNVPSHVLGGKNRAAVSLWPYLVAMTDGQRIWWQAPHPSARGSALWTMAWTPATAAPRLLAHYRECRKRPLPEPLAELVLLTVAGGDCP
ncbi:hypothetical protein [Nonomuraea sp. LPB2021202275-12-8]|uniref:hypothetical protein n=1 Tax=Nonomuraea sp. LPB2021202275-12-8 TaxID=3120159 RepID=UPI00300D86E9